MEIAGRVLRLRDKDRELRIPIRIFAPTQALNGEWSCRYEIKWPDGQSDKEIWGHDSAQALLLALQTVGAEIYTSSYHKAGKLYLDAPGQGYGFPVSPSLRDLLQGDDAPSL